MAKSLANFIVGIGADVSNFKKGAQEVNSGMMGIRTGSLAMSATLSTIGLHAVSTAKEINQLGNAMQFSDADMQYVYNYGHAIERMGGQASEAIDSYKKLESTIDRLQKLGEHGKYTEIATLGIQGQDAQMLIRAKNVEEFNKSLADIMSRSNDQTRRMTQSTLGFSDAQMKLLVGGAKSFNDELAKSESLTGNISKMRDDSAELVSEWNTLWQNTKGFGNELASSSIPAVTDLLKKTNEVGVSIGEWYRSARDFTSTVIADELLPDESTVRKHHETMRKMPGGNVMLDSFGKKTTPTEQGVQLKETQPSRFTVDPMLQIQDFNKQIQLAPPQVSINTSSQQQQIKQPVQLESTLHVNVELDGRVLAEAVEKVNQEDYFIMNEGIKGTTAR